MKREASLQRFLLKLRQKKKKLNENVYDKSYPPSSALARIYGTPKMHKFSSSDTLWILLIMILPASFVVFFHL